MNMCLHIFCVERDPKDVRTMSHAWKQLIFGSSLASVEEGLHGDIEVSACEV